MPKTVLVAMPLMARSGVYHSTLDFVRTARDAGHDVTGIVAVRPDASGDPVETDGVVEVVARRHGRALLPEIRELLASSGALDGADAVVTMIPQSDMVVSGLPRVPGRVHIAYVRGLPWPEAHTGSRLRTRVLTTLEVRALRRADEVWATSPILRAQIARAGRAELVPAGVPALARVTTGGEAVERLLWAGRLSEEKGAAEFLRLVARSGRPARLHGSGPLEAELRAEAPSGVDWAPWMPPASLWSPGSVYLCTSRREAFGRSPVEAALAGLPVVLSDTVGCAAMLYTDPELRQRFVLPLADVDAWLQAIEALGSDAALRRRVSDHVHGNASKLTIEASVEAALARIDRLAATRR